jgi:peptide/nickel transport system substrate-binding protein
VFSPSIGKAPHLWPPRRPACAGILLLALLTAACGPPPAPAPPVASPTSASVPHAPQIAFGLVGEITDVNVWALFAGQDYSYNAYAVRSQYWPRLYADSIPDGSFLPVTARGLPTQMRQEGAFYTAEVPLRTDLKWSDGSPFSARDVAFTINTALTFQLGFDWRDYYDPQRLDHAEAASSDSVKFYFKQLPGIHAWQYGALQGPVVQESFWSSKVAKASELLPGDDVRASIETLDAHIATLQKDVNDLYAATLSAQGEQARQLQSDLKHQQGNLDEATNSRAEAQAAIEAAMLKARQALFDADDNLEPLLGLWMPAPADQVAGSGKPILNVPNAGYPGPTVNFDRLAFSVYSTRALADQALDAGEINLILDSQPDAAATLPRSMHSPTRNVRLLVFNLASPGALDAPLRQALACILDQSQLAAAVGDSVMPLTSFLPQGDAFWQGTQAQLPCAGMDSSARFAQAVESLKAAGYSWEQEPTAEQAGTELKSPDGQALPRLQLLAPDSDPARAQAARYVEQQGLHLGLPVSAQVVAPDVVDYAVLSSLDFNMAILGWKVSRDPGYLCDWFEAGAPFHYESASLTSQCGELAVTSDLERARSLVGGIQRTLADELPMLPLFSTAANDSYRGITYPFTSVLDGLTGVYGAPQLAAPAAP